MKFSRVYISGEYTKNVYSSTSSIVLKIVLISASWWNIELGFGIDLAALVSFSIFLNDESIKIQH